VNHPDVGRVHEGGNHGRVRSCYPTARMSRGPKKSVDRSSLRPSGRNESSRPLLRRNRVGRARVSPVTFSRGEKGEPAGTDGGAAAWTALLRDYSGAVVGREGAASVPVGWSADRTSLAGRSYSMRSACRRKRDRDGAPYLPSLHWDRITVLRKEAKYKDWFPLTSVLGSKPHIIFGVERLPAGGSFESTF